MSREEVPRVSRIISQRRKGFYLSCPRALRLLSRAHRIIPSWLNPKRKEYYRLSLIEKSIGRVMNASASYRITDWRSERWTLTPSPWTSIRSQLSESCTRLKENDCEEFKWIRIMNHQMINRWLESTCEEESWDRSYGLHFIILSL